MNQRKKFRMFVLIAALVVMTVGIYCTRVAFADTVPIKVRITPKNLKLSADARAHVNCHARIPEAYESEDIKDCSLDVLGTEVDEKKWKIFNQLGQARTVLSQYIERVKTGPDIVKAKLGIAEIHVRENGLDTALGLLKEILDEKCND